MKRYLATRIKILAGGLVLVVGLFGYHYSVVKVEGKSMEPTVTDGSHILVNKRYYINNEPERFDVILLDIEEDHLTHYIKRIIGLPGETIRIKDGTIFVNNKWLLEPTHDENTQALSAKEDIILGSDEYFVLGDNRNESIDSRYRDFGMVTRNMIQGKMVL